MGGFSVPVVDISAYVGEGSAATRGETARRLDDACREVGFVQVVGHGVPEAVIDGLKGAIDAFFGLDLDVKKGFRAPPRINRGYTPPRSESLSLSLGVEAADRMNDFFEAFNVGIPASAYPGIELPADDYAPNLWPEGLPEFRPAVQAYFAEAARVARTLTGIFADALGLPPGYFAEFTGHSLDVLRMNNYALPPGEVVLDGDLTGMGEHTDYGIVTVLWADREAGLQVLGHDGGWHDVMPAEGALLVNLGDLMARWTNDAWRSTLHRVKPPVVDGSIRRRRSAAYFHDGNIDARISTLPNHTGEGTPYPPITVAEHIRAKLAGSREGRSNPYADREAARVRAAADA
ncbi:isopenicillin N synthase-like dioxygenase [Actinocorallia herbida]|uniref:Isopenicillin N synthase-like dioxygenase n=1 Tax=Actinocorallia herbida TaxID=58109 RepID=A0A3N1D550_9ACTN|nr:2-oxoglutarate and iron-dependent oxygenase domain-containing protein [Actinocorallia herbida]ROO88673.1 isopenicillin N synthase-like dioxygenase [Actinocorallia herbida]